MVVDFKSLPNKYLLVIKQIIHKNDIVQKKAIIQMPLNISDGFAWAVWTKSNAGKTKFDTKPDNNFFESLVKIFC
ncbi:hypothetical protein A9G09_04945 [Gilliamella sp. wkB292]|nr:hypothetical protein A9G09_04945 [Gilliamella apicola]